MTAAAAPPYADAVCTGCLRALVFFDRDGFVHREGMGARWQTCARCGWEGSDAITAGCCPVCGSTRSVRDDHVASPDRGGR